ncbi:MAG: hypothetical protein LBH01_10960 [Verrucomicrobiales bacterium]|jgi:hypothetical protein|nr:hypothetical protein [Verrucomicrobiales bacterium]
MKLSFVLRLGFSVWFALLGITANAADDFLQLLDNGVVCDAGAAGKYTLGIPALDGRGTHLPPLASSIKNDGRTLTAAFGEPFAGVSLEMKILAGGKVQYRYANLPKDLRIVMCQFNIDNSLISQGVAVSFDGGKALAIPVEPGKTNKDASLANVNASKMELGFPSGETLTMITPKPCWHGIQDSRVWGKKFVGICLTPFLTRDQPEGDVSTFVLEFTVSGK